jgi:DtxR family Mn-dependent transcriptional regulator
LKITISKENYLKTIAEAESEGETVIAATLARWLKVSAPAVTMAIRRLKRDDLIRVAGEGQITLTRSGRAIANRLLTRHHLIERMLTEIFGMEWYKVRRGGAVDTRYRRISNTSCARSWETGKRARTATA